MILSKFLDPKLDITFKRVFGTEKNKDILINFLNDMLSFRDSARIQDVSFIKTNQDPEVAYKKQSIVDILCVDQNSNKLIVEMQVANSPGFEKRAQYYAAKTYCNQMNRGDNYGDHLKEVIFLAITNFTMFKNKAHYKSDHVILDLESHEHDLKDFSFTFLELPKFKLSIDQLTTPIERWAYFLKYADETSEQEVDQITQEMPSIKRAYDELNKFSWSEQELHTYEQEIKRETDNRAIEEYKMQQAIEKAVSNAVEQTKNQEKLAIAKNLLSIGISVDQIAAATLLSIAEIEKLKN